MTQSCDPGPAPGSFAQTFNHVRSLAEALMESMFLSHAKRKQLIEKYPKPNSLDPLLSAPVQRALAYAHEQGRYQGHHEAMREVASLIEDTEQLRKQFANSSGHHIQAILHENLQARDEPPAEDSEDTVEREALRSQTFQKEPEEMLYTFFIKGVNSFHLHQARHAYSARLSPFNISFLEKLIPKEMNIRLIPDKSLFHDIMILM